MLSLNLINLQLLFNDILSFTGVLLFAILVVYLMVKELQPWLFIFQLCSSLFLLYFLFIKPTVVSPHWIKVFVPIILLVSNINAWKKYRRQVNKPS